MRTWQQFDRNGLVVGSITAETIADACKKTREMGIEFPILVEIPKEIAMSIQKIVEEKTNLEIYLAGVIEEQINVFQKKTGVPISNIVIDGVYDDKQIRVEVFLNINAVK